MQDNKDKRPCKKLKVNFTYKKPTDDELRNLIDSSRCKNTDYSTSNWIRALEKFRTDVNYQGLIEEVDTKEELEDQLCRFVHAMRKKDGSEYHVSSVNSCMFAINRHLNNKSVLSKPINIMDKDQYYKLWQILNGKVKSLVSQGRGERNGADGFTEDDLLQILDHPAMSGNDPATLSANSSDDCVYPDGATKMPRIGLRKHESKLDVLTLVIRFVISTLYDPHNTLTPYTDHAI
ncbi:hypothetical protein RhiirA1_511085 [Rhizophagus irregularis]|uniref:Uncharacterized protein n=1 Tax=Rhizophagus irregularis TaxID=588596 RepID=A0A2N0RUA4_9GLOM|nr:hypothetical protein RhiirA1_511085 [Rhizophagus irregularis]